MPAALFSNLASLPLSVEFDSPAASSEGGAALLAALDRRLGFIAAVVSVLADPRNPKRVIHNLLTLFRQRIYLLALGYFDANDSQRLRHDPLLKLLLHDEAQDGPDLASQPTLSRFENALDDDQLDTLEQAFAQAAIDSQRQRRGTARMLTLDFDPTCDPTHGGQQMTLFNGFYGTSCYLPLVGLVSFDHEPEQWVVAAHLRGGCAPAKESLLEILDWLLPKLRAAFPRARLRIRLDAGFQGAELLSYFQREGIEVVLGLAGNKVLERHAQTLVEQVQADWQRYQEQLEKYREATAEHARQAKLAREQGREAEPLRAKPPQRPGPRYGQVLYGARKWDRRWRVVIKAGVAEHAGREPKVNVRYVLTDIGGAPRRIYERIYCPRGDAENRLKELKAGLGMDRTSCCKFTANRLRVLLAAMAYALLQHLRWEARGTSLARAQVERLRGCLLKLAARVERARGRWRVHLSAWAPWQGEWLALAARVGAVATP